MHFKLPWVFPRELAGDVVSCLISVRWLITIALGILSMTKKKESIHGAWDLEWSFYFSCVMLSWGAPAFFSGLSGSIGLYLLFIDFAGCKKHPYFKKSSNYLLLSSFLLCGASIIAGAIRGLICWRFLHDADCSASNRSLLLALPWPFGLALLHRHLPEARSRWQ